MLSRLVMQHANAISLEGIEQMYDWLCVSTVEKGAKTCWYAYILCQYSSTCGA